MSIFIRPDSPPPRMPSPDIIPEPLSSPPIHSRSRTTSRRCLRLPLQSQTAPIPPCLIGSPLLDKTLLSTRSCDHLREKANPGQWADGEAFGPRGTLNVSPPTTPRSLPLPSPTDGSSNFRRGHRRTLSFAIPYRSPPPSPTIASRPPPVPPIPAFVLSPTDKKPILHTQPTRLIPIYLPEPEAISPISEVSISPRKQNRSIPAPRREKSTGMTCLKFFSLRNSCQRGARTAAV